MVQLIPNLSLTPSDLPDANSAWQTIREFALTFDGYIHWGSFEKCAAIANQAKTAYTEGKGLPVSLTALRTCLFFEQRRWRHFGEDPDAETMEYIQAIVANIWEKVLTREVD